MKYILFGLVNICLGLQYGVPSTRVRKNVLKATIARESEQMSESSTSGIIQAVEAREILDSRGNPTVEVEVTTELGVFRASVPSGASTGAYEAVELRDGGSRYMGKGVLQAIKNVQQELAPLVIGMNTIEQRAIDEAMLEADGTKNKAKFGANAILGVSLAVAKAGAASKNIPLYQHIAELAGNDQSFILPVPAFNVINGGSHAGNALAFQEYFVIPDGAESFSEAMQIGCEVYHTLKSIIKKKFGGDATLIGDEGGFAPPCDARSGVELVMQAISDAGYQGKCSIGLDVAASEFKVKDEDIYDLGKWYPEDQKDDPSLKLSAAQLAQFYQDLCNDFPIVTIEDAFDEDDWSAWIDSCASLGTSIQLVGDDLTVTNPEKIQRAINEKACNALLLKVNQIGSVTESIDAVKLAKSDNWGVMTSHRSGETEDTYIADIAVGLCTGQIKTGAPCRSERLAKYNQLLRIESQLGDKASYAGSSWRKPLWMG
mmetsp:Transcript_8789/g.12229  ORF Transcript_8789/g.12229 Transcript_8789/m.12229 type:complete len:487 (+) Transcript_8789:67-1527(+)